MTDPDFPDEPRRTRFCLVYCGDDHCICGMAEELRLSRLPISDAMMRANKRMEEQMLLDLDKDSFTSKQNTLRLRPVVELASPNDHIPVAGKRFQVKHIKGTDTDFIVTTDGHKIAYNPETVDYATLRKTIENHEQFVQERGIQHPWLHKYDFASRL